MNERIKELAKQAGVPSLWIVGTDQQGNQILEKFAELIVKECASKVDWILAEGGKTQGDLIRQHFGVEK